MSPSRCSSVITSYSIHYTKLYDGYEAVNVEAQSRNPSSLMNWTKRMIAVRKNHKAFSRGTIRMLEPGNRKILAYVREWEDESILCVVNLSRTAQPVELDLSDYKGRVPVELLGRAAFPPTGELPYLLTLKGYGTYSFRLATDAEVPFWHGDYVITSYSIHYTKLYDRKAIRSRFAAIIPVFGKGLSRTPAPGMATSFT